METRIELGRNRTGIQMSPIDTAAMTEGAAHLQPAPSDLRGDAPVRESFAAQAAPLGSVPLPVTLNGVVSSGVDMLTGNRPQVLIDKLGERLAFERGGVRLYDALLLKCRATDAGITPDEVSRLAQFRDEEAAHFRMVADTLRELGGDPTAQTPGADLVGTESLGLVQAMNDPRTSFLQCLHVMLDAELIDNAGWDLLTQLSRAAGHAEIATGFQRAVQQEALHLETLRQMVTRLTMRDANLSLLGN